MKKIPTIFKRDHSSMSHLLNVPHPDCDWVFNGEGVATQKYDGTCCLVKSGVLYKRREVKKNKPVPDGFVEADYDEATGKKVGWLKVTDDKSDKWHREAFQNNWMGDDGTFELVGPKIQGNPEGFEQHELIPHAEATRFPGAPTGFDKLRLWLSARDIEGLVWHHPDGRMAKIKKRDFGLGRKS